MKSPKMRYWTWERCADAWHASRDARSSRLDQAGDSAPRSGPVETYRTQILSQLGRSRSERVWAAYQSDVFQIRLELAEATTQRNLAAQRIEIRQQEVRDLAQPSESDLRVVRPGEEVARPGVVAGRRTRDLAERRGVAESELAAASATLEARTADVARLDETLRARKLAADAQVAVIDAYVKRRRTAYLARLLRRTPGGQRTDSVHWPGWEEQPSWLTAIDEPKREVT